MHRPALFGAEGQQMINAMIDKGWLVITEFDDQPDFLRGLKAILSNARRLRRNVVSDSEPPTR